MQAQDTVSSPSAARKMCCMQVGMLLLRIFCLRQALHAMCISSLCYKSCLQPAQFGSCTIGKCTGLALPAACRLLAHLVIAAAGVHPVYANPP